MTDGMSEATSEAVYGVWLAALGIVTTLHTYCDGNTLGFDAGSGGQRLLEGTESATNSVTTP